MEFRTGYFAKIKTYEQMGYVPIGIVASKPKWFQGLNIKEFAPPWDIVDKYKRGIINEEKYTFQYIKNLSIQNINQVLRDLKQYNKVVFLCYEKLDDFCHRHLLANYLQEKYLIPISEFSDADLVKEDIDDKEL